MARHDNDDFDYIGGDGAGPGARISGLIMMVLGTAVSVGSVATMFYETDMGFGHGLREFQKTFALVLLFGVPVLFAGVWVFKLGKRIWKG